MIDQVISERFAKLYDETYKNVLKFVVCNCSSMDDVEDIVQSIYLELLKLLQRNIYFNNDNAYVMGIAKNKVNEYYRFKYRNKIISLFPKKDDFSLLENVPSNTNLQEEFIKTEDIKFIWEYLKTKKIIIFKVFYLYYYMDMSIKRIAIELDISESNVKHYLYRTLSELKKIMNDRSGKNVW